MPFNNSSIDYSYSEPDWSPSLGNLSKPVRNRANFDNGYHNEQLLRNQIAQIQAMARATISASETQLETYSLNIASDPRSSQAQEQEWPAALGEPRSYISYKQYKALETRRTRGAEYLRKAYEDNLRGPFGTNAIDVISVMSSIKNEADNIEQFLDDYLGGVSDTSEYRALELLQDWAENAIEHTRNIGDVFTQRIQNPKKLPSTELDRLGQTQARNYQAFFQTKINAVNSEIKQLSEDLSTEYGSMSEIYYKKHFGPGLMFQRTAGVSFGNEVATETFLGGQAALATRAMANNYISILADQLKRNESFNIKVSNLLVRMSFRDDYAGYTQQLNTKSGEVGTSPFLNKELDAEEIEGLEATFAENETRLSIINEFSSGHSELDGLDDPLAHPQYLLRAGDTITGDILLAAGIKIGGVDLPLHAHTGEDGTVKIKGSDIDGLIPEAIDRQQRVQVPQGLTDIGGSITTSTAGVVLVSNQIVWQGDPKLTYEIQMVPVGQVASIPAPVIDYTVTTLYSDIAPDSTGAIAAALDFVNYATSQKIIDAYWDEADHRTLIAGSDEDLGDIIGDSIDEARFSGITDIVQDHHDGRLYIADGDNRKIKMTGPASTLGHTLPMNIETIYLSNFNIKKLDSQGTNFLNSIYAIVGPDINGKDRVIKLSDLDGDNLQAGSFTASEIPKISGVYSNLLDIAVASNGYLYLLGNNNTLYQYDPYLNSVRLIDILNGDSDSIPVAISVDHYNHVFIAYSGDGGFIRKLDTNKFTFSLFAGSTTDIGSDDGLAIGEATFNTIKDIAFYADGVQRVMVNPSWNRLYVVDQDSIRAIHSTDDIII